VQINPVQQSDLILIVEDDEDDSFFIQRAFEKAAVTNLLKFVNTASEALAYLNGDPPYTDRAKYLSPGLILLDVRMPVTDGFEVLKWVRNQARFAQLRVVVLTGSEEKRAASYELGANSFMLKPLDSTAAAELSRSIERPLAASE
jgi:CheY-like chemotaxis protein